jgi:hypothetical protein
VTVGIVDLLEPGDVHCDQGEVQPRTLCLPEGGGEPLPEGGGAQEAGERVVAGVVLCLLLGFADRALVADHQDVAVRDATRIAQCGHGNACREGLARATEAGVFAPPAPLLVHGVPDLVEGDAVGPNGTEDLQLLGQCLLRAPSRHAGEGGVGEEDHPCAARDQEGLLGALEGAPRGLFEVFGLTPLGDVADRRHRDPFIAQLDGAQVHFGLEGAAVAPLEPPR